MYVIYYVYYISYMYTLVNTSNLVIKTSGISHRETTWWSDGRVMVELAYHRMEQKH